MKQCAFLILIPLLFIFSCKKDTSNKGNSGNGTTSVSIDSFPLVAGHSYNYHQVDYFMNSSGIYVPNDSDNITFTFTKDTLINGQKATEAFQKDSSYNGYVINSYSYYRNRQNGAYEVAYRNVDAFQLYARQEKTGFDFNGYNIFGVNRERLRGENDSLVILDTALYLLKLPVKLNDLWTETSLPYIEGAVKRKWLGYASITTSAGTFNCAKLQVFTDLDNDNLPDADDATIYEYISDKGLIEIDLTLINGTTSGGSFSAKETIKLSQVNF